RASSAHPPSAVSDRECPATACACGSQTAPVTSCPRAASATRNICSSWWAKEWVPRFARPCAVPFQLSHPSIDLGCGNRMLSTGCEFFRFLSRFLSNPSRLVREERTCGMLQPAARMQRQECRISVPHLRLLLPTAALLHTLCDGAHSHLVPSFADGKAQSFLHGPRGVKLTRRLPRSARHRHVRP